MNQRLAARIGWLTFALTFPLGVGGMAANLAASRVHLPPTLQIGRYEELSGLSVLGFGLVGALIVSRRRDNWVGWICLGIALGDSLTGALQGYLAYGAYLHPGSLPALTLAAWLRGVAWLPPFALELLFLPLLFPDGRLPSRRWRPLLWLMIVTTLASVGGFGLDPQALTEYGYANPVGNTMVTNVLQAVFLPLLFLTLFAGIAAVVVRFRTGAPDVREQIKWFVTSVVVAVTVIAVGLLVGITRGDFNAYRLPVFDVLWPVALTGVPVAIGFAILRYRLYDIDLVINKALVYAALAAFITLVYVAIVVGIGQRFGTGGRPNLPLSIVATVIVAVAFQPARESLQKLANRLVYGERATPYQALADFSRRLAGAVSAEDVLPRVAEAAGSALNVQWAAASLTLADGSQRSTEWGTHRGSYTETVDVRHEGELLGHITLLSTEPFANERTLAVLNNFANQAGALFRNLRLTAELQAKLETISSLTNQLGASRQRIVAAADEERRRLELEISQQIRPQLVAVSAELRKARDLLPNDDQKAADLIDEQVTRANETLDSLRELARGVFPPLLVDKGVVPALQAHVRRAGEVELDFDAKIADERFPAPVEAALYFSCVEALRGVSAASIRLEGDGDWIGCRVSPLGPQASTVDIRDRVEALGGVVNADSGKYLEVKLPARPAEADS